MASRRATGTEDRIKIAKASGVTIAEGDLVKKNGTSNNVTNASMSGAAVLGIACQAAASSSTDVIEVDVLHPGDKILIDVEAGTPASGDFKSCDYHDCAGADVGTNTNHDLLYRWTGQTGVVEAYPKILELSNAN